MNFVYGGAKLFIRAKVQSVRVSIQGSSNKKREREMEEEKYRGVMCGSDSSKMASSGAKVKFRPGTEAL